MPRVRCRLLRLRDGHLPRPARAQRRVPAADRPRPGRAPAQRPALRRRPGHGRRRRRDARRRGPRRPHRPELRLPGAQGHPQGRRLGPARGSATCSRAIVAQAVRHAQAACRSPSRCARASTPTTSPTSRPAGSPRPRAWPPSPCTPGPPPSFYSGTADWSAIARLKEAVTTVPVLGNGDIWSARRRAAHGRRRPAATAWSWAAGASAGRGCSPTSPPPSRPAQAAETSGSARRSASVLATLRRHLVLLVRALRRDLSAGRRAARLPRHPQAHGLVPQGLHGRARRSVPQLGAGRVAGRVRRARRGARRRPAVPGAPAEGPRGRANAARGVALPEGWLDSRELDAGLAEDLRAAELAVSGG